MTFNYDLNFQYAVESDVSMMNVLVDLQYYGIDMII
jgi:hypothetical protein